MIERKYFFPLFSMTSGKQRITVALGGNALQSKNDKGTWPETTANGRIAMRALADLVDEYDMCITHGNGPQVGTLLLQNDLASKVVPTMPMYVCGAQTQGYIGFLLQQEFGNALIARGKVPKVTTVVTQTEVSLDDPAWSNPTKPVGSFYTEEEAKKMIAEGATMKEDSGRGWRVVVASPQPQNLVEFEGIKTLVDSGFVVIGSGGGGIPVVRENGQLKGVAAVIDKDLSAAIFAQQTNSDMLLILTDVPYAIKGFRTPEETPIRNLTLAQARQYIDEGVFAAGSMKPKVQACVNFVAATGKKAIITSLHHVAEALRGETGTHITA
ncbi:hypothetical protein RCL1_004688 [Eukaryota sp. TZLM3-RCL]